MASRDDATPNEDGAVPKWQVIENLVAVLEWFYSREAPGATVVQKALLHHDADPERRREVDVLVTVPVGRRALRIGVDVKNEKAPLDVTVIEQLVGKYSKLKRSLDRYCIVSTSGFSGGAEKDAKAAGVELLHLCELADSDSDRTWKTASFAEQISPQQIIRWAPADGDLASSGMLERFLAAGRALEISVEMVGGERRAFLEELVRAAREYLRMPGVHTSPFSLQLYPERAGWVAVHFGDDAAPAPREVVCRFATRLQVTDRPSTRFQAAFGVEADAAVWSENGRCIQVTTVKEQMPDGSMRIFMQRQDARPSQVAVDSPPITVGDDENDPSQA